ncbi:carboxylesterase/lipase family protein [Parablautia muri]|uniref:Carboxylic ester hydrolase n=1 Tax=Parablautia muri TaxID=2320879 RepID=A0A9X5BEJ4_9FIRM|nr:carboxylesterase family protein [Parablautia muri]NBJ92430.1 carboxylesterase/lipase family protein [Parablautia muri]
MVKEFLYDDVPVLETTGGKLKGYFYNGEYIFKGVPYAEADRFQMPRAAKWEGIKDACSYGFVCPLMEQETPSAELLVPHRYWPQNEHCQNLNIWTKALDSEKKMPVVVWLHGGGYSAGSSIEQVAYDGFNACMNGDVVVVSVNHRLNILGYLDLSPFGEKYKNSGNVGHADMVAALKWIHENIALFGGDSENVTIFGQSGGGMKVADLMQIEEADGLFHKGLIMSGVGDKSLLPSCTGNGQAIVTEILKELSIPKEQVERLETVPYDELVKAYKKVSPAVAAKGEYIGGNPLVNDYYKGNPLEYGFREHAFEIPVMVGSVFGEFVFMPIRYNKNELTYEQIKEIIGAVYGEHTDEMIELFQETYPGKSLTDLLLVDRAMRQPSKRLARLHAKGGKAGTYLYDFILEFPIQHNKIAWHCSDIPFFFHNTELVEVCQIPDVGEKLEKQIFEAFMTFAKTGKPQCDELPVWEAVTPEVEPTMIFDKKCEIRYNFDDKLYERIDSILPPFNLMEMMADSENAVQH